MAALQCPKLLHLRSHHPHLEEVTASTMSAFATGNQIGELARTLYATQSSVYIDVEPNELDQAVAQTQQLIRSGHRAPIFEATFRHEGVLVRVDVLVPEGKNSWRLIEVKASTRIKPEHLQDCAVQTWVCRGCGIDIKSVALAHVDNSFVYIGANQYDGILTEEDVTNDVDDRLSQVPAWVDCAREAVRGGMPDVDVGPHCTKPYECGFFRQCWPTNTEFPIHALRGSKKKHVELVLEGFRDIREVPADRLSAKDHLRIHSVTISGSAEILAGAGEEIANLKYPRYYLDFETISPAIPIWPDTRPYEAVPVQWSIHIEQESGGIEHREFLDLSGEPPMRALAEAMLNVLGDSGPVVMYTSYEKGVIEGLARRFRDLAQSLDAVVERLWDLKPVVKENYCHPDMLGSWSIKSVLPTIAPELRYEDLDEIQDGSAASNAFLEAISPDTSLERKTQIKSRLLKYCEIDTEAMVRLVSFFTCTNEAGSR